jgi:CMP-N,N'-diacetyllegionaminic acid synthase
MMIDGLRVIALTPARGGSKAVPYKNLHPLGGKPLLAWPVQCALQTPEIDRVLVSTDDDRIAAAATELGAEVYRRPDHLATDTALVADTIRQLWAQLRAEGEQAQILVLLEATSPFRTPVLVSRCLRRLVTEQLDSVATFNEADINPERTWRIEAGSPAPFIAGAIPWKPRQLLTPAYQLNGAVYAFFADRLPPAIPNILFGKMGAEVVPSDSVIDIDTLQDFNIANALLQS